ncbi:hypothetical protein NMY22_g12800 [Coprinellus aureogranulatus]|nr:hypothetical protein NMY22_g12800 [Coprinellus aureogranulatus]
MGEIEEEIFQVTHFVPVGGASGSRFKDFLIGQECVVPRDTFDKASPDDQCLERRDIYSSKRKMNQKYRRSVLIIFRDQDEAAIRVSINGVDWAIDQLYSAENESEPSEDAELIASALLKRMENFNDNDRQVGNTLWVLKREEDVILDLRRAAPKLRDKALDWGRAEVWNAALPHCFPALKSASECITPALEVFDFKKIKPGLSDLAMVESRLKARFEIIDIVAANVGKGTKTWVETLRKDAVTSYTAMDVDDVLTLVGFVQSRGPAILEASVLPNADQVNTYMFLVALAKAIQDHRESAPSLVKKEKDAASRLAKTVRQCITLAIPQWQVAKSRPYDSTEDKSIRRIKELVSLCFITGQADLCASLDDSIPPDATYPTRFAFAKSLHRHLVDHPSLPEHTSKILRDIVQATLQEAAPKWEENLWVESRYSSAIYGFRDDSTYNPKAPNERTNRICELVDLCCTIGKLEPCVAIFDTLLEDHKESSSKGRIASRFKEIYRPLVFQLKLVLAKHGRLLTEEPFAPSLKLVVSMYLTSVLGPVTPKTVASNIPTRQVGCGFGSCNECKQLQKFVNDSTSLLTFRARQDIRKHVETQISKARIGDIVTTETSQYGVPRTLSVNKRPKVVEQMVFKEEKERATEFLKSVGSKDELKSIMGERYKDMKMALEGTNLFATPAMASFSFPPSSAPHPHSPGCIPSCFVSSRTIYRSQKVSGCTQRVPLRVASWFLPLIPSISPHHLSSDVLLF